MKIAVSVKGKTNEDILDTRFGRCEYFKIYDIDNKQTKIIDNKGKSANGGAGVATSNQLIEENIDVVITGSLGPNAFDIVEGAGIKAYKCESICADLVIEKYNNGELEEIKSCKASHQG